MCTRTKEKRKQYWDFCIVTYFCNLIFYIWDSSSWDEMRRDQYLEYKRGLNMNIPALLCIYFMMYNILTTISWPEYLDCNIFTTISWLEYLDYNTLTSISWLQYIDYNILNWLSWLECLDYNILTKNSWQFFHNNTLTRVFWKQYLHCNIFNTIHFTISWILIGNKHEHRSTDVYMCTIHLTCTISWVQYHKIPGSNTVDIESTMS